MSIRLKLLLLISLLFITGTGNTVFTFLLESYGEEKLDWVNHTNEVIYDSERFLSSLKDTETGQRGFLLTKNAAYLQPYYGGLIESEKYYQKLKAFTIDNQAQQKRLDLIRELMQLKFDELAQTIELTQNNSDNRDSILLVKDNKGKLYMDEIRSILSDFNNEEALLLEQRKGDFKASRAMITTLIAVEFVVFIFLAVITFSFLSKSFFKPLDLLVASTRKTEEGKPLEIIDVVSNDEMGYLLSRFYTMSEKIQQRTIELDYKAHHDKLTGLKNRTKMFDEIESTIRRSKQFDTKFAIFFMDLNDFKVLNDTLGHDAGDVILKETATRVKNAVRSDDSVYRIGGDEFLVLIKDINTVEEVQNIVSNILKATESPVMIQGQQTKINLSLGVAVSPDDSVNSDELVKFSDIAMYAAKRDKDAHYKFYDSSMLKRFSDAKQ